MKLNTLRPAEGEKSVGKRRGRGIGSGLGKTAGRGHKGQKARSGGFHKIGFEGGQMPLQRRLPKFGFMSRKALVSSEIRLSEIDKSGLDVITIDSLKEVGLIQKNIKFVKVMLSGEITRPVTIQGIKVTAGAAKAVESAGGKIEA